MAFNGFMSRFAFAEITSVLLIGPIPAFTILIFDCFSKVINASKLPRESALMIIPSLSKSIACETSFLNFSVSSFKLSFIFWKGIPDKSPSL